MGLPINSTSRLNIVGVNTASRTIKEIMNYAASPGIATPAPAPLFTILPTNPTRIGEPIVTPGTVVRGPYRPPVEPSPYSAIRLPPPTPVTIPKVPIYNLHGVAKLNQVALEKASADFVRNKPLILFVVDYIIDGLKIGNLVVFKKYKTSTHYELFKKNIFADEPIFQRILFLDAINLQNETIQYKDYLRNKIGLTNLTDGSYYAIMDPLIKDDRIYEYKVLAAKVPSKVTEIDYDFILESKGLLSTIELDRNVKKFLPDVAVSTLGSKQLAWIIALVNEQLYFFDSNIFINPVVSIIPRIVIPKNMSYIKGIFDDSVSLFGLETTLDHMLNVLGGLTVDFRKAFNDSLNKISKTFSYGTFISNVKGLVPVFNIVLSISEHSGNASALRRLSQLNIVLPNKVGTETYTTIEGLSKIFDFVSSLIYMLMKSQDNSDELKAILDKLNEPPPPPPAPPPAPKPPAPPVVAVPTRPVVTISSPPRTTVFYPSSPIGTLIKPR